MKYSFPCIIEKEAGELSLYTSYFPDFNCFVDRKSKSYTTAIFASQKWLKETIIRSKNKGFPVQQKSDYEGFHYIDMPDNCNIFWVIVYA